MWFHKGTAGLWWRYIGSAVCHSSCFSFNPPVHPLLSSGFSLRIPFPANIGQRDNCSHHIYCCKIIRLILQVTAWHVVAQLHVRQGRGCRWKWRAAALQRDAYSSFPGHYTANTEQNLKRTHKQLLTSRYARAVLANESVIWPIRVNQSRLLRTH